MMSDLRIASKARALFSPFAFQCGYCTPAMILTCKALLEEKPHPTDAEVTALSAGIPLVEGLVNLRELPSRVPFFAPFYRFAGIDSAPARAFALIEE